MLFRSIRLEGDDLAGAHVDVEVELDSLEILEGTGGAMALTASDREDITKTARRLLDVEGQPRAGFSSTAVTPSGTGGTITGTLTLHGTTGEITVQVEETGPSAWTGTTTVLQSAYCITPYKAFFGALKLADPVSVEVTVDLSGA